MKQINLQDTAHLFVAAIRVLTHQHRLPPSVESVCEMLSISEERGHHICRRLDELGITEVVKGAFGTKLFVRDYLAIENIPKTDAAASRLDEELKKFQEGRKDLTQKVASFHASQEEKKKRLFADLEKQLKIKGSKED